MNDFDRIDARARTVPEVSGRTRELTTAALLVALLAGSAWIAIPVGAVPVTLQVFVVLLAALLLRPRAATAALLAYLALGAIGIPVFSGGLGGVGVLLGPTGGYLFGFLFAAGLGSLIRTALERRLPRLAADVVTVLLGIALIYSAGWLGLRAATGMGAGAAFVAGVAPFLLADALKGVVVLGIVGAVRRAATA